MKTLQITEEGKINLVMYDHLPRRILMSLIERPKTLVQLVTDLRIEHYEYKYVEIKYFMAAVQKLIKDKMVVHE